MVDIQMKKGLKLETMQLHMELLLPLNIMQVQKEFPGLKEITVVGRKYTTNQGKKPYQISNEVNWGSSGSRSEAEIRY